MCNGSRRKMWHYGFSLHFAPALQGTPSDSVCLFSVLFHVHLPPFYNQKVLKWKMNYISSSHLLEAHTGTIPDSFLTTVLSLKPDMSINTRWQVVLHFITVDDGHWPGDVLCCLHVLNASLESSHYRLLFPFCRWHNWISDSLSNVHKVTHFWNKNWNQSAWLQKLHAYWLLATYKELL